MKKIIRVLFVGLVFLPSSLFSQATNDAGLWATFNVDKKINKTFFVFATEEFRMRENITRLNLFYTDLGIGVKPFTFLKASLAYRNIEKYSKENTFSYRHRLMLDITLKKKIQKFALSYRQRIQAENRDVFVSEDGNIPEWYSRNKFEIKYDLGKPVTPYIAAEFRYQFNNPRLAEANGTWHRNRYFVGLDYKKSDKHEFGLYYMIQQEFNISAPQNQYIIGVEYSLSL